MQEFFIKEISKETANKTGNGFFKVLTLLPFYRNSVGRIIMYEGSDSKRKRKVTRDVKYIGTDKLISTNSNNYASFTVGEDLQGTLGSFATTAPYPIEKKDPITGEVISVTMSSIYKTVAFAGENILTLVDDQLAQYGVRAVREGEKDDTALTNVLNAAFAVKQVAFKSRAEKNAERATLELEMEGGRGVTPPKK